MKNIKLGIIPILIVFLLTSCGSTASSPAKNIPSNTSVSVAWSGKMCEINKNIYYVGSYKNGEAVFLLKEEGKNKRISGEYSGIRDMTTDGSNIYFVLPYSTRRTDTIYSLNLSNGKARKIHEGSINNLQYENGKLYWKDESVSPTQAIKNNVTTYIFSCNKDGSGVKRIFQFGPHSIVDEPIQFLATEKGIYYSKINNEEKYDIFLMDFEGNNGKKLNNTTLDRIDKLFFDQGKLYFLMQNYFSSTKDNAIWDTMETFDANGESVTMRDVGYYPEESGVIQYCGISGDIIYYFFLPTVRAKANDFRMNLHQYDINSKRDSILLYDIEMGGKSIGTINSVRGRIITNARTEGMYILGNDIYFSTQEIAD